MIDDLLYCLIELLYFREKVSSNKNHSFNCTDVIIDEMGHDVVVPVMLNDLVLRFRNDGLDKYLMNFCLDPIIHLIKH